MITLKSLTIVATVLAGGTSLAMAQNGPATGGQPPVAGGAGGNPILNYYGAPGYFGAPGYYGAPGYAAQPGYVGAPRRVVTAHPRNLYLYAPGSRHKKLETGQPLPKQPRQAQ
jgi:hypothetical protein